MSKLSKYSNNYFKNFTKGLEDSKFSILSNPSHSKIQCTSKKSLASK